MAKNKPENKHQENPESQSPEQTTKEIESKDQEKEKKPEFKELLSKGKDSLTKSSLPGSEDDLLLDENIVEVCADVIAIPFAIWHEINKNVQPLSEKEKENISKPLAKVVTKYDLGRYMKEEFVLVFYLGSAIYGRS